MASHSQFKLLTERRFAPLFWTQFLGAANDNLFKFAFTLLATYTSAQWGGGDGATAGFVIGAIFIAPFLLFSATSGQLADKFERCALMRFVKSLEIAIMVIAAWGFATQAATLLYVAVFFMGLHSTLFGPVKYAYLPQHLKDTELTGGNGLVEMGTFVAILLGTMAGGLLVKSGPEGPTLVATGCVTVAVAGRIAAHFIPHSPAPDPALAINWKPVLRTWHNLRIAAHGQVGVQLAAGISCCGSSARSSSPPSRRSRATCCMATRTWSRSCSRSSPSASAWARSRASGSRGARSRSASFLSARSG
jgi:MFS family permease